MHRLNSNINRIIVMSHFSVNFNTLSLFGNNFCLEVKLHFFVICHDNHITAHYQLRTIFLRGERERERERVLDIVEVW